MNLSDLQAAVASVKVAGDIVKGLVHIKNTTEIQSKVIEIQTVLLDAQQSALSAIDAQFNLQTRVRELEEEVKKFRDWGDQQSRYTLVTPWGGAAQVYGLKRSEARGENPHYLCPNCFLISRRSILNPQIDSQRWLSLVCPNCKANISTGMRGANSPNFAEDIKN